MNLSYDIEHTIAILIGTGQYLTEDFPPIAPVKGNLEDLRNILIDKSIIGLEESNIYVIENKSSTEILKKIKEVLSIGDLKTVLIYYSGHGYRTSKDKLFLTATNSEKDFDVIELTAVEFSKLKNIIEKSTSKPNSIIILDACYSGIATQGGSSLTDEEENINGACIIASSSDKEQSFFSPEARNTYFTEALIEILNNGSENSDDTLSIDDIYKSVKQNLKNKHLSEPRRKDNLNSDKFHFAKNKKFDKDFFSKKAEEFFIKGNYAKALDYYNILEKRFMITSVNDKIDTCKFEITYSKLIIEADNCFTKGKYEEALISYEKAEKIRPEGSLGYKIEKCRDFINIKKVILENQKKESDEYISQENTKFESNDKNEEAKANTIIEEDNSKNAEIKYAKEETKNEIKEEKTYEPEKNLNSATKAYTPEKSIKKSNNKSAYIIAGILAVVILIVFLIVNGNKGSTSYNSSNYTSSNKTNTSSTTDNKKTETSNNSSGYSTTNSGLNYSLTEKPKTTTENNSSNSTSELNPEEVAKAFITDLGNRNFYSAYVRQNVKKFKTYEWFSSTNAFGGINYTKILESAMTYDNSQQATVIVHYRADDPANNNYDEYYVRFSLDKYQKGWIITDFENIPKSQWKK